MATSSSSNDPENPGKSSKHHLRLRDLIPFLFLALLSLLLAVALGLLLRETVRQSEMARQATEQKNLLEGERDDLLRQLSRLEEAYEALSRQFESLEQALQAEQEEVARLREIIRRGLRPQEARELDRLLQQCIIELEEMIARNEILMKENLEMNESVDLLQDRIRVLQQEADSP